MAEGRDDAYDAEVVACHRCAAADRTMSAFRKQEHADTAGVRPRVFARPPLPDEEDADQL